jgi:hypothetical protein
MKLQLNEFCVWDRTTRVHTDPKQQIIALVRPNVISCTTDSHCKRWIVYQLDTDFHMPSRKLFILRSLRTLYLASRIYFFYVQIRLLCPLLFIANLHCTCTCLIGHLQMYNRVSHGGLTGQLLLQRVSL